jgi:hypothetical protein
MATAASLSIACVPSARGIRVGEGAQERPPGCALAYEQIAPADAQVQWRQVGDVCVSSGSSLAEPSVEEAYEPGRDMNVALNEQACALGGEIVTPIGLCSNGKINGVEFGVYVPKR